jgi:hypothetical protein
MDVNKAADNVFNSLNIDNINDAGLFELQQAIGVIDRLFLTPERAARLSAIRTLLQNAVDIQYTGRVSPPAAGGRRKSRKNHSY